MNRFLFFLLLGPVVGLHAQSRLASRELSLNGFRNPSIGLEYRYHQLSVHAGYYLTNFTPNTTTRFLKTGLTLWVLPVGHHPVGHHPIPSSFYVGASYLRGLNRDYEATDAVAAEVGFRWMIWRGLNLRLGVIALKGAGNDWQINPTPGISYAIPLNRTRS